MSQSKYKVTFGQLFGDALESAIQSGKIDPNEGRLLFTGASVKSAVYDAGNIMKTADRMTLKLSDFEKAIQNVYENSRKAKNR
jgi:ATP-dependent 26S proteasome regulatory subunit